MERDEIIVPFFVLKKGKVMEQLNFYTVDLDYVEFLKNAEVEKRGFSRVPDMDYGRERKPKFLCGIVLQVNNQDYYVPISSYKVQQPDNFLIYAGNDIVVGSLRFNYMFPVPKELITERRIDDERDRRYRTLLAQELRFCIENEEQIRYLAERTYKRVLTGKNPGLVTNSCDFRLLEERCEAYRNRKPSLQEQLDAAEQKVGTAQPGNVLQEVER